MTGNLYKSGTTPIFRQSFSNSSDGVHVWLFSDENELKNVKFENGTYRMDIVADLKDSSEVVLSKYVKISFESAYLVTDDYDGKDVELSYNSKIADESFGLLVVTKLTKCNYGVTATNATIASLGGNSYMITNVIGDVVISVTTTPMLPEGYKAFYIAGVLEYNSGFRVVLVPSTEGGLYEGDVALYYTYSTMIGGVKSYGSDVMTENIDVGSQSVEIDFEPVGDISVVYGYAVYSYIDNEDPITIQTLGVLAPAIPKSTITVPEAV